jgi:large subunit ribosomal protein L53
MLTKYLTSVTTAFSPFNPKSGKTARNFLALLPPTAHKTMAIDVKILSQAQKIVPATLALKFSMFESENILCQSQEERMLVDVLKSSC